MSILMFMGQILLSFTRANLEEPPLTSLELLEIYTSESGPTILSATVLIPKPQTLCSVKPEQLVEEFGFTILNNKMKP